MNVHLRVVRMSVTRLYLLPWKFFLEEIKHSFYPHAYDDIKISVNYKMDTFLSSEIRNDTQFFYNLMLIICYLLKFLM